MSLSGSAENKLTVGVGTRQGMGWSGPGAGLGDGNGGVHFGRDRGAGLCWYRLGGKWKPEVGPILGH